MNDVFDDLESQLRRAVRARRRARPAWLRRGHRRTSAIALLALLAVSAGALAAGGVIQVGAPAERSSTLRPAELRGGGIVAGTARLLSVAAPDPAGGPPWGMRVYSEKRGEGCVQVGRLLDGKIGALGQDSAFHDDGRFHEFTPATFSAEHACSLLDGAGRLFVNATVGDLSDSAWDGIGTCVPSTAGHYERTAPDGKPYPVCKQVHERNLYYGLLGPGAQSITYVLDGRTYTQPTSGPEGAYLLVTKASPKQLFNFNAGGTQDVVPVDGPITELHYRDGATCHLTARSWIGGKDSCTPELAEPVDWTPFSAPAPTPAQVVSPLHVRLVRARKGGDEAIVQFTSRVAIESARSSYWVEWHESGQPKQVYSFGKPRPLFAAAGHRETMRLGAGLGRGLRPGKITGQVVYENQTGPGRLEEAGGTVRRTVGRFALTIP